MLMITEGDDYVFETFNITIPAGDTSASFNISISDDDIFETNESFSVTIDSSSLPHRLLVQSEECMVMVTIFDDDGELFCRAMHIFKGSFALIAITVTFDNEAYVVHEDAGIVQLLLFLSNPSSLTETVQMINEDITATGIIKAKLKHLGCKKR